MSILSVFKRRSSAARHLLNTRTGRRRKRTNPVLPLLIILSMAGAFIAALALPSNASLNTDPDACHADIYYQNSYWAQNYQTTPLVVNDVTGADINGDGELKTDDSSASNVQMPFSLSNAIGNSTIEVNPNGWVSVDGARFDVFHHDLDATASAHGVEYGSCRVYMMEQEFDAYSVTWNNIPFYGATVDQDGNYLNSVSMQIIFVKTADDAYTVIRNYISLKNIEGNELRNDPPYSVLPPISGPDVKADFFQGSDNSFVANYANELMDPIDPALCDGSMGAPMNSCGNANYATVPIIQNQGYSGTFTDSNRNGRYFHEVSLQGIPCDTSITPSFQVSYSAPGVESVNQSFNNVVTENFDQLAGQSAIPSPYTDGIGTWNGDNYIHEAGKYWGAGGSGMGAVMNDETLTAPSGTCYKYIGFLWSAGSPGNDLQLLDANGLVLASFTATDLYNALKTDPNSSGPCPDSSNAYCGRSGSVNPVDPAATNPEEPWVYVNLRYSAGFSAARFYQENNGLGFEMDNVSVSPDLPAFAAGETYLRTNNSSGACNPGADSQMQVSYSAPGVQSVNFQGVLTEDFNEISVPGNNQLSTFTSNVNHLTFTDTSQGSNLIFPAGPLGGADGVGNGISANDLTVSDAAGTCFKYIGFWWSAGSGNNNVQLLDAQGNTLASFSSADLFATLGGCPDPSNGYCGNPNGFSDSNFYYPNEPFAYVNIRYPSGFNSIRLFGSGFEMDNFSISSVLPGSISGETNIQGPSPSPSPSDSSSPSPSDSSSPSPSSSQSPGAKPVIQGLDVNQSSTNVYARPEAPQKQFLNNPTSGDEGWFICDSAHLSMSDYDLSTPPSDCTFTDDRSATFSPATSYTGKYVGYGAYQANGYGATWALQTASQPIGDVAIVGLANAGALAVTNYSVLGSAANVTAQWYRCDNPATSPTSLPQGCVGTGISALSYTVSVADVGKFMVYSVSANSTTTNNLVVAVADGGSAVGVIQVISGYISNFVLSILNNLTGAQATGITYSNGAANAGGQWWICTSPAEHFEAGPFDQSSNPARADVYAQMQQTEGCQAITGQSDPSFVAMQPQYDGQFLTYASAATINNVFLVRTHSTLVTLPTPTPTPTASASSSASPSVSASSSPSASSSASSQSTPSVSPSVSPSASASASASSTPTVAPTATPSATPTPVVSPSSSSSPSATAIVVTPTNPRGSSNGGAVVVIKPTPTPSETQAEITPTPLATSMAAAPVKPITLDPIAAVKQLIVPKADPAIGATGNDNLVPHAFSPLETSESAKRFTALAAWFIILMASSIIGALGRERKSPRLGSIAEVDAEIEYRRQRRQGWGDRLPLFRLKAITWLDRFSADAIRVTYPKSPVLAKIFNEGAYLRAFFGSLTILGSLAAAGLGVYAALTRDMSFVMPSTWLLLAIVTIGVFDAFAGLLGSFALVVTTLLTMHSSTIQDYRTLLGLLVLGFAPALSAEAFRPVRRRTEKSGAYAWERISDFAIAPFIGGISTVAMVSVLPALANLTLPVANHVIEFGLVAALGLFLRVALEEFAGRAYPTRMDALNPDDLKQPTRLRKFIGIVTKAAVYIFISTAIFGLSWQVWVACLIFVIPALMHLFEDRLPNSRTLWRFLPKGIPGMALSLVIALSTVTIVTWLVRNPVTMARYGFMLLAIPALVLTALNVLGRHGQEGELKPILHPDRKWLYRLGGIVMYGATVWLVANA
jgi:hypothetical protein